jgi:hypothetical protein
MERSRKRSSSAESEKMERVGDRLGKMEGHCSTGQSTQWAVAPRKEEEEEDIYTFLQKSNSCCAYFSFSHNIYCQL